MTESFRNTRFEMEGNSSEEGHLCKQPCFCLLLSGSGKVSAEVGDGAHLFWRNVFLSSYIYNIHIRYFNAFQGEADLSTYVKRISWKQANNNFWTLKQALWLYRKEEI